MENSSRYARYHIQIVYLTVLTALLLTAIIFIARQFVDLNANVEYERSVFISQIADQMKNNVNASRINNLQTSRDFAAILSGVQPKSFEEVRGLFPDYASSSTVNRLFFLSSQCELYGIDGVRQWVSLPYDGYLLDALFQEHSSDFIRIGIDREYMVYSTLLPVPAQIDGREIAAVFYAWDSSEYRAALSSRLFEEKSSSLLVGKSGNIAIYPETEDSETYGYNVFTYLRKQGMSEPDLDAIRSLINGEEDTTMLCQVDNGRWLFRVSYYSDSYRILIMLPIQITSAGTYRSLSWLICSVVVSLLVLFLIVVYILLSMYRHRRAQREKELQTELLMKTAQAKNEFLAKMSHDIRTPLNGIIGMNYIASSRLPPEYPEIAESLKKVDLSAKYLLGILNDILDMSKIESGKVELASLPFSLSSIRDSVEPIILSQMAGKDVQFLVDFQADPEYGYLGDEMRIKQILMNLLSNAVKFTNHGSVTLSAAITPVNDGKDEITFTVRDTGKGMSRAFMDHIFSPFTQENAGIEARYGGSGLGLAIVKSYVDLMGGAISVTSEKGVGSEFTVTIPFEKTTLSTQREETLCAAQAAGEFSGKRALLCEDNDLNAEIAIAVLDSFGMEVDRAENGKTGVEMFQNAPTGSYDIIFMDVRMPVMDGYEATHNIRMLDRPDARRVVVCALSANAFSDDIRRSLDAGMNEHLAKPLDIGLLTDILKKYLNG